MISKLLLRLWPSRDAGHPWQELIPQLYSLLSDRPVAWTDAVVPSIDPQGRWLPPLNCLVPDEQYNDADMGDLRGALLHAGLPLICQSLAIVEMMKKHMVSLGCRFMYLRWSSWI